MEHVEGSSTFGIGGAAYQSFMGRYSVLLAQRFADSAGVRHGQTALDVGCGPGALAGVLVERLGADAVAACDPSEQFVADCSAQHAEIRVDVGRIESIPFDAGEFDHVMAQLVLHFATEPDRAVGEMKRVAGPGGCVSACVWDFGGGMELLRGFWDAALEIDPAAPDEATTLRFGRSGEIADLFESAGLDDVVESTLTVSSRYEHFEELWAGCLAGAGPAGAYCVSRTDEDQALLRAALFARFGSPPGPFELSATAHSATGRTVRP